MSLDQLPSTYSLPIAALKVPLCLTQVKLERTYAVLRQQVGDGDETATELATYVEQFGMPNSMMDGDQERRTSMTLGQTVAATMCAKKWRVRYRVAVQRLGRVTQRRS